MAFDVVPAETTDIEEILDCWVNLVAGQRSYGSHLRAESNRTTARDLLGQYVVGNMLEVARSKGETEAEILGFVTYYLEEGVYEQSVNRGVIENVYVKPETRGKGVGSALLSRAEAELTNRGADVVAISALSENESAIELYEERGYTPHRVVMERPLDED